MPKRLIIIALLLSAVFAYYYFDLGDMLTLEFLKSSYNELVGQYQSEPATFIAAYFAIYVAVTAVSLPGATILTLAGGALFGLVTGTIIVSFASTTGATLAFLFSRYLFREALQDRFGDSLKTVNEGVERDGKFYLFTLRLIPVFPFFLINLLMGLTPLKTLHFFWISQLGMLGGTIVYVNAGTQLAEINSLADIFSADLVIAFSLLGLFPLLAKLFINRLNRIRVYKDWNKPGRFDHNLVVVGAGSAGLVTSYIAATVRSRVTLIEAGKMGGDCLNTGCVPSKALIRSAGLAHDMEHSADLGIDSSGREVNFPKVMERIHQVIGKIEPHDSIERYTDLGVECIQGFATIKSPWEVEVNGTTLATRNIVIATGAKPFVPPIPGLEEAGCLTSENLWDIRQLPQRLVILGGGPIGCELAQAFARLGAKVTQVEMLPVLMNREDSDVSEFIRERFEGEGISVMTGYQAVEVKQTGSDKLIQCKNTESGEIVEIACDEIICAVGRKANSAGFGLEELGVELNDDKTIRVNDYLQSTYPNIYACGDVAGPYQFTHIAAHQAWYASVNALFGKLKKFRVDYSIVPWCTYTDPEVARVGLNEQEANEKNVKYEVTVYGIDDLDRAITDSKDIGFIKVLTVPGKDKILGVTIVGHHAGDLVSEYVLAMKHGIGLNKILGTIHIYPTLAEGNKFVAGEWKKAHKPEKILGWLEKFHSIGMK